MAKWTKETIPNEFRRLVSEGKTYVDMRKNHSGFISAIHRLYDGIIPFCEEIGVDYNGVVSAGTITKYKADKASKADIDNAILRLFSSGEYVKASELYSDEEKSWIYQGAIRHYGSWHNALRGNGLKPFYNDNVAGYEDDILSLYSEGKSGSQIAKLLGISESAIYEILKQNNVETDAKRYTRGLYQGVKQALCAEEAMTFVKKLLKESADTRVNTHNIKRDYPFEYFSVKHHYKTFSNAFKVSGEYLLDKGVPKKWSKGFLLSQIKLGHQLGKQLNSDYLIKGFGCSTETYAREAFGSWENAVRAAGIDYESIRKDGSTLAPLGHEFESVLSEILTDLNLPYTRYDHERYRPDFVLDTEWVDAKLSQFTYKSPDDNGLTVIDKYEPYCDKLTLVFLRGNKECDVNITEKTRLVNVYKYVNKLPDNLRGKYYAKLDEIERKADAV